MDALIEFLLKYRPAAFSRGTLAFAPPVPLSVVVVALVAIAGVAIWLYARSSGLSRTDRLVFGICRLTAVALVGWCLLRPVLIIAESITQRNVVAILVDDSRSMRVPDVNGAPRANAARGLVGSADSALIRALAAKYQTRVFRTTAGGKVTGANGLSFDGGRTRLLGAVERVQDDLAGTPVAGVIVLSDGADNAGAGGGTSVMTEQLLTLRSRGVPVYTIGIGSPRYATDVEVSRVDAPRQVLRNSTVLLDIVLVQRGLGGAQLPLVVEDSGRIVGSATVTMPKNGEAKQVRIRIPATETGARLLRIHVPPQPGEMVRENNERRTLLVVRDRQEKVLHFEGEPRPEIAFTRRAVQGDPNVALVTLLRSAKDKFLRLGVADSLELVSGFPKTREELFTYRGLVLGSVEASFFSGDQLRMISDFVSERGGGLMLLGGRSAFAEGGYLGTALGDAFPVELGVRGVADTGVTRLTARPTPLGTLHPAVQIASTDAAATALWDSLPPLTTVNTLLRAKPGATVLLNGQVDGGDLTRPLLVAQRFGRGRVLAMGAQDTWLWQMQMAVDDSTHETLWRQMLRWLVSDVPDRVEGLVSDESGTGEAVALRALVNDSAFIRSNGASVSGVMTSSSGASTPIAFDWAVDRDGEYTATYVPDKPGVHELALQAVVGADTLRSAPTYLRVAEPTEEYFGSELRTSLLQQVADETGGKYYSLNNALNVAKDLVYSPSGSTVVRKNDLWDMPLVFLLLAVVLGVEWTLRRRRGLA